MSQTSLSRACALRHRLNRAMNLVHAAQDEAITLQDMAAASALSSYHFSRAFKQLNEETPIAFLWRIRLERAARRMVFSRNLSVGGISAMTGFSSPQSFAQSFKRYFGTSPSDFRTGALAKKPETPALALRANDITFRTSPPRRVAYIRRRGRYARDESGIPLAFARLRYWALRRELDLTDRPFIGLCPDNRRITPAHLCVYDACLPVPGEVREDREVSIRTIPGGRYAVIETACAGDEVLSHWEWLTTIWRIKAAGGYDQRWSYEVFHPTKREPGHSETGMDLYLRLADDLTI